MVNNTGVVMLDLATPLQDHPDWLPGKAHPGRRGAVRIAQVTRDALTEMRLPIAIEDK